MGGIAPTPDKGIVLEGTHFYTANAVPFADPLQPIQINVQDLRDAVGYGPYRTDNEFWPFKKGELSCALKAIWDVWEDKPADAKPVDEDAKKSHFRYNESLLHRKINKETNEWISKGGRKKTWIHIALDDEMDC